MLAFAFALLSAATSVLAHGIVEEMTVSNPAATYVSYNPYQDAYKNPVPDRLTRKFPSNGPVEDITGADIQCNVGAEPAALVGTVAAGAQIAFNWTTAWPTSHIGPVITYMARAPSDITQWSPGSDAVWFKIDEAGLEDGKWAATDVLIANGGIHSVTIPSSLKAGQYLIRHEIIALHGAQTYPGAQFYPMCAQFEVTGSGSALPDDSTLVSFPGAYGTDEPGVVYNPYEGATTYPIPGPAVWDGTGSGTGSGGASSSTAVASPTTTTSAVPSSTVVASSTEEPTEAVPTEVVSSTEAPVSTEAPASTEAATSVEAPASTEAPEETSIPTTSAPAAPTTTQAAPSSSKAPAPSPTAGAGVLAAHYAQCGGKNHNGPTACEAPYTCKQWNEWYYQCV